MRYAATVVALLCSIALRAETERWKAVVAPPRPDLPAVTVFLGEPGHVSTSNAAIDLRAVSGTIPFDGYIGYHFEVDRKRTLDIPVVARAVLKPHEPWSFPAWVQLRESGSMAVPLNRELVVEWRDRSMRVIAKRVAGTPPWSEPRPLRIIREGETLHASCCLGTFAHVRTATTLPEVAQWYAAFSDLVIATDLWLDLPMRVREAAFASGVRTIFIGVPRPDQKWTEIDRAIVPVEFLSQPGEFLLPWPYRADATPVSTPVTWRPKPESDFVGTERSPYLVTRGQTVFVADESLSTAPLPVTSMDPVRRYSGGESVVEQNLVDIVSEYRVVIAGVAIALFCAAFSIMARRSIRALPVGLAVLAAVVILACRDQLRPSRGVHLHEEWTLTRPDLVVRLTKIREHGPTPIGERRISPDDLRLSVSGAGDVRQEAEVRTPATAPGHGAMYLSRDGAAWDTTSRWSARRGLGQPVKVAIRSMDRTRMVFDYEAPFAAQYAMARWIVDGVQFRGEAKLQGVRQGRGIIEANHFVWATRNIETPRHDRGAVSVTLARSNREHEVIAFWSERATREHRGNTWAMRAPAHRDPDGKSRLAFALPAFVPEGPMLVEVNGPIALRQVVLTTRDGSVPMAEDNGMLNRYRVDGDDLLRIASEERIVIVTIEPDGTFTGPPPHIEIAVKEKRS
ncbi:MAG TPA: hypothetical protein VNL91_05870 [Thermoanaerobaculia bacterium]|nr:hypothetical protein [Thermoanaerobaculia bacterium]